VHVIRETQSQLDEVRAYATTLAVGPYVETRGSILEPHWMDGTFDCIAIHDALEGWDTRAPGTSAYLDRILLLLKPRGWLIGASANPWYLGRRALGKGLAPRAVVRLLKNAGFREVRLLFVRPSLARPLALVPDDPRAIRAFDGFRSMSDSTALTRRVVARLGIRSVLFPAYFVLASP
jgi:hypothetical protein